MGRREIEDFLVEAGDPADKFMPEMIVRGIELAAQLATESEESQAESFERLLELIDTPVRHSHTRQLRIAIIYWWAKESESVVLRAFAKGYAFGKENEHNSNLRMAARRKQRSTKIAAQGRKLIGHNSKLKVKKAAENLRHKSKEAAAYEISATVGLSPGRVRQLLSELFPGRKWHASDDT